MKSLTFPILSIIAAVGLYYYVMAPKLEVIDVLLKEEATFDSALADVREIENIIGRLESTYASITREDLEKLERFLPRKLDRVRTTKDLYSIIGRDNVEVEIIDIEKPVHAPGTEKGDMVLFEHETDIRFYASYESFKEILKNIESSLQIARINEIIFTVPEGESQDSLGLGLYTYEMSLTFYTFDMLED